MDWTSIVSAIGGAVIGGAFSAVGIHISTKGQITRQMEQTVVRVEEQLKHSEEEQTKNATAIREHHEDGDIHISTAWREEVRSRLENIERLQTTVLTKLINNDYK